MTRRAASGPIRCGVIGYGGEFNMGRHHLHEMQSAGMKPTAICEIEAERLKVAGVDFPGIETYTSVGDMLARSDVELISIITPHHTHAPLAIECLRAGRHVVSEKPMAITTTGCDAMIIAARDAGVMVTAYHNRHWDGPIRQAVKHIVEERAIGDIVRIDIRWGGRQMPRDWWRSDRRYSGGVLYDWGVHLLEYAFQLLPGAEIVEVAGFAHEGYWPARAEDERTWHSHPNEDDARAVVRMSTGASIDLTVTTLDPSSRSEPIQIVGTDGAYAIGFERWTRTIVRDGVRTVESAAQPLGEGEKFYQNVHAHLLHGAPLVITPEWSRRPVHVLDLAAQSVQQGRTLPAIYS